MRHITALAIIVSIMIFTVIFVVGSTNYIIVQNKITGELINTTIRVDSYNAQWDSYGFSYLKITDTEGKGYLTQIGWNALPAISKGNNYTVLYGCDSENNRRIVSITSHDQDIYKCTIGECTQ